MEIKRLVLGQVRSTNKDKPRGQKRLVRGRVVVSPSERPVYRTNRPKVAVIASNNGNIWKEIKMIANYVRQLTEWVLKQNLDPKTMIIYILIAIILGIYLRRFIFRLVNRLIRKIL